MLQCAKASHDLLQQKRKSVFENKRKDVHSPKCTHKLLLLVGNPVYGVHSVFFTVQGVDKVVLLPVRPHKPSTLHARTTGTSRDLNEDPRPHP